VGLEEFLSEKYGAQKIMCTEKSMARKQNFNSTTSEPDKDDAPVLRMTDICKDYHTGGEVQHVLKNISLEVNRGEYLAVLGPSGSGKSTLMNIIGCLDVPTSGTYELEGRLIGKQKESELSKIRGNEIGFIFQQYYLLQKQTAYANVELPLIYANVPERKRRERVEFCLEQVGLSDKMKYYPNQLSGGQQQRVAIARAVVNHPSILLADEPTGALDQQTGAQVMDLFHKLSEEGNTIIMITHDIHIAAHARRVVKILDGVISEGKVSDA
jgi:putative ABC transport system ATP-binding protein